MKKIFLLNILFCFFNLISSASDTIPPVITLVGNNTIGLPLNTNYVDPGATAFDNVDGDVTASIVTLINIDENVAGTYSIFYSASDAAGNYVTVTRTVIVFNQAEIFNCVNYNSVDACTVSGTINYNATITASTTVNRRIRIQNFGGFGNSAFVEVDLSGTTPGSNISWSTQTISGVVNIYSSASGGTVTNLSPPSLSLTYQWSDGTSTEVCASTYTAICFLGIPLPDDQNNLSLYPNPFMTEATIAFDRPLVNGNLFLFNMSGQEVIHLSGLTEKEIKIMRNNLTDGMYILKITDQHETIIRKLLIK
jgi:hypothetical protein